jgi:hypothetical protein
MPVPNLDDRSFDDLVQEGQSLIPTRASEWTNHNASDPGVTILELFAYVTEMLLYQTNRITDHHREAFLRMLAGSESPSGAGQTVSQAIEEARRRYDYGERAVTGDDYERLAKAADEGVARAQCVPGFDLTSSIPVRRSNHISVLVIPCSLERPLRPSPDLLGRVSEALEKRRLLATHLHVVAPRYVPLTVKLSVVAKDVQEENQVRHKVAEAVRRFLDPLTGGSEGSGWPAGQRLYVSDLLRQVHAIPEVEYLDPASIVLGIAPFRVRRGSDNEVLSVLLRPGECFEPEVSADMIRVTQGM